MTDQPQTLTAPDGTEMVLITKARFDALIAAEEELGDIAAADEGRTSLAEEGGVPLEIEQKLAAGQSGVFAWRRYRGLNQAQLGEKVGVTQAAIARIEARPGAGRADTLLALAKALDAPLWTLEGPEPVEPMKKLAREIERHSGDKMTGRILRKP